MPKWRLLFLPEAVCEYGGITLRELYLDPSRSAEGQQRAAERCRQLFGMTPLHLGLYESGYTPLTLLGVEVVYLDHAEPMPREGTIPEPRSPLPAVSSVWRHPHIRGLRKRAATCDRLLPEGDCQLGVGGHGVITDAKILLGQRLFTDVYDDLSAVARFLDELTGYQIEYHHVTAREQGLPERELVGIWDDCGGMLPPALFARLALPNYRRTRRAFPDGPFYFHDEELHLDHLPLLADLGIDELDFGWERHFTLEQVRDHTDFRFNYTFNYIRDLKRSTPAAIKDLYRRKCEAGGERLAQMKMDVPAGTPPANIEACLEVAQECA